MHELFMWTFLIQLKSHLNSICFKNEEFEEEDVRLVDNAQADGALSQRPSVVVR